LLRDLPIDREMIERTFKKYNLSMDSLNIVNERLQGMVPCSFLHPHEPLCLKNLFDALIKGFRKAFGMYLALHSIPVFAFKTKQVLLDPMKTIIHILRNTTGSTLFLSSFLTIFQFLACSSRNLFNAGFISKDRKQYYFLYGMIAGVALLIEKKHRRSELALYVLPRAIELLVRIMIDRKMIIRIKHAEIYIYSLVMGILMSFYKSEKDSMSPLLNKLMNHFLLTVDPK
jgi:hypothetical protein